jgi:hypothetical protein
VSTSALKLQGIELCEYLVEANAVSVIASSALLNVSVSVSWKLLVGFHVTHLPANVDGNQKRLLRHLHGIDLR